MESHYSLRCCGRPAGGGLQPPGARATASESHYSLRCFGRPAGSGLRLPGARATELSLRRASGSTVRLGPDRDLDVNFEIWNQLDSRFLKIGPQAQRQARG
jgi:hypothetical protein